MKKLIAIAAIAVGVCVCFNQEADARHRNREVVRTRTVVRGAPAHRSFRSVRSVRGFGDPGCYCPTDEVFEERFEVRRFSRF